MVRGPENMAFDNNDVRSMNSPLIILSWSRDGTAGKDTGEFWVALTSGSVKPVCMLLEVRVCGLSLMIGGT